jgi:predicted nucleic acid-binding protein
VKLFDTSSLIAAMLEDHEFHEAAQKMFLEARDTGIGCVCAHSIAELYSVLSGMPRKPKISPQVAKHMIEVNLERFQRVPLEISDYEAVIDRIVTLQLSGGVVFDALIAHCALKIGADAIVTLNAKHFRRLGADVSALVVEP